MKEKKVEDAERLSFVGRGGVRAPLSHLVACVRRNVWKHFLLSPSGKAGRTGDTGSRGERTICAATGVVALVKGGLHANRTGEGKGAVGRLVPVLENMHFCVGM
ncbi:hypothetical protein NPIL_281911 [Nephila pilipes]|uniref:Uncharacterized protein n=1 Tax=Nephila pilipes TaxID=299642 RepID=A0A8X6PL16_NEPPI|nr:hypothetical protein NPIL_281911 [Nephila pilipes]